MTWCYSSIFGVGGLTNAAVSFLAHLLILGGTVAVVGLGGTWLATRLGNRSKPPAARDPLDTARRRLAEGKISPAEFEEIRNRVA